MSRSIPLSQLPGVLRRDRARVVRAGKRGTRQAIEVGAQIVRKNAPKAFGELRDSVRTTSTKIVVDAPHAAAVEEGSRPHTVPLEELILWVKLRGMQGLSKARIGSTTSAQASRVASQLKSMEKDGALEIDAPEKIARAIQRAIELKGTAPHWFALGSLPELYAELDRYMRAYIDPVFMEIGTR